MTYSDICEAVAKLKVKYDETDPFRLCRAMGITLLLQPMGSHATAIKGFFMECKRIKTITVNSDLPEVIQKIIGRDIPVSVVNAISLFGMALFMLLFIFMINQDVQRFVLGG